MKTLYTIITMTFLILLLPVCALSSEQGYMRIRLIEGDVQIKAADSDNWDPASVNEPVGEGDQIWTRERSRVELQLNSGTYIRLDELSSFQVLSMDGDSSQFYLSQGYVYINNRLPKGNVIQVDTPDVSTRVFKKSIYRIDLSEGYTYVSVYKGNVETENRTDKAELKAGQEIAFGPDANGDITALEPPDEWEKWNKERNRLIQASRDESTRYLPSELRSYSRDFDDYGRWVSSPQYGYVWTPTVIVGTVWSPYRHGRWIVRHGNYIWVATESWGWVPYHYGRWAFISGIGWSWVPPASHDVCWGPGFVGWVRTPEYVAWVPLAPGEIYYGRGNYGRDSVNMSINIVKVPKTRVYQNVRVDNSVMIVNRDRFTTGPPKLVQIPHRDIRDKIFSGESVHVFTPETHTVRVKRDFPISPLSDTKRPPASVQNIRIDQLKHSRPFIREPDRSVFRPGMKPESSTVKSAPAPATPDKGKPSLKPDKTGVTISTPPKDGSSSGISGHRTRDDHQRIKPEETRTFQPDDRPSVRHDRRKLNPEDKNPSTPAGTTSGKDDRNRIKPEETKTFQPDDRPSVRHDRRKLNPEDKNPSIPAETTSGKDDRNRIKPEETKTFQPDDRASVRHDRRKLNPEEKAPSATTGSPSGLDDRKRDTSGETRFSRPVVRDGKSKPDVEGVKPSLSDNPSSEKNRKPHVKGEKDAPHFMEDAKKKGGHNKKNDSGPTDNTDNKNNKDNREKKDKKSNKPEDNVK